MQFCSMQISFKLCAEFNLYFNSSGLVGNPVRQFVEDWHFGQIGILHRLPLRDMCGSVCVLKCNYLLICANEQKILDCICSCTMCHLQNTPLYSQKYSPNVRSLAKDQGKYSCVSSVGHYVPILLFHLRFRPSTHLFLLFTPNFILMYSFNYFLQSKGLKNKRKYVSRFGQ